MRKYKRKTVSYSGIGKKKGKLCEEVQKKKKNKVKKKEKKKLAGF